MHRKNIRDKEDDDTQVLSSMRLRRHPKCPMSPPLTDEQLAFAILSDALPIEPLARDSRGRLCRKIADVAATTSALVRNAVRRFRVSANIYPSEIIPCPSRYNSPIFNGPFYIVNNVHIPLRPEFQSVVGYDILCRGKI